MFLLQVQFPRITKTPESQIWPPDNISAFEITMTYLNIVQCDWFQVLLKQVTNMIHNNTGIGSGIKSAIFGYTLFINSNIRTWIQSSYGFKNWDNYDFVCYALCIFTTPILITHRECISGLSWVWVWVYYTIGENILCSIK